MYINPYENLKEGAWCKTNFHTHAGTGAGTCGSNSIDMVFDIYKKANYNILCISNHDIFSDTDSFTDDQVLMVPGVEYSQDEHMLTIGVNKSLHQYNHQTAIKMAKDMGGFTIMCHPNWIKKEYWSWNKLNSMTGFTGIEVINMLIYRLQASGLATDTWDFLLSQGKLVFGFGNDDFHLCSDAARSYNLIYCKERNYNAMKEAIDNGSFCASTGLIPDYLKLEDDVITVKASFPVPSYIDKFTYKFISENGKVLSTQSCTEAKYKLNGETYIRVEVIGENGAMLFFQPVYLDNAFHKSF